MTPVETSQFLTLVQREFREYKASMLWTPLISALILGVLMLLSVIFVNRIGLVGETVLDALMKEGNGGGLNISISVNEDAGERGTVVQIREESELTEPDFGNDMNTQIGLPAPPPAPDVEVIVEETSVDEEWNFSREWTFNPPDTSNSSGGDSSDEADARIDDDQLDGKELNAILSVVHGILLIILLGTTANYLLSALHEDRKDRSILFWRSMPVGEWQIVLSKFVVAIILTPIIYIAISLVLQLAYVLLTMFLVLRMGEDPFVVVVGNIDFMDVMLDPISGWIMTALLIAPTYAWLLCASALAKRSPFLIAVTPFLALFVIEAAFFNTEFVGNAVTRHFPHVSDTSAVGFYLFGPDWTDLNLMSVAGGLAFTMLALAAAVWLRNHRWELS
ncbi:MAG: hypothetical protein AB8B57_16570 [Congregibacter sp.]